MPSCGNEESNGGEVREHSCWMLERGDNFEWETHKAQRGPENQYQRIDFSGCLSLRR